MRIKKFRLAEAVALAFLATVAIVASTSDRLRAAERPIASPLGLSVGAGYILALVLFALAFWLARDAIRRR